MATAQGSRRPKAGDNGLAEELVSRAMHRDDVVRVSWRILDLLPELRDVHVDRARQREVLVPPDDVEEAVARHDLAAVLDEVLQDVEFARRQLDRLAILRGFEAAEVHHERS